MRCMRCGGRREIHVLRKRRLVMQHPEDGGRENKNEHSLQGRRDD